LKHTPDLALWYPTGCSFDLVSYADTNYAGFLVDRKSTLGMAHFLGPCLVSWQPRDNTQLPCPLQKAEYVTAASYCAQLLWIRQ